MCKPIGVSSEEEYRALRAELAQGWRYVFERPLLIIMVSAAGSQLMKEPLVAFVPFAMVSLLLFNLSFTVNRIRSIARIVAYIQIVLEGGRGRRIGWENSLRYYRKWKRLQGERAEAIVAEKLDRSAVSDGMLYYPAIYRLHAGIVVAGVVFAAVYACSRPSVLNLSAVVLTTACAASFLVRALQWPPSKVSTLIEADRVVWLEVYDNLEELENVAIQEEARDGGIQVNLDGIKEPEVLLRLHETEWQDHIQTRAQTWRALGMSVALAGALIGVDWQLGISHPWITITAAFLLMMVAAFGFQITLRHRNRTEIKAFTIITEIEKKLGLQTRPALKPPGSVRWWDIFLIRKANTSLFLLRMHAVAVLFGAAYVLLRAGELVVWLVHAQG